MKKNTNYLMMSKIFNGKSCRKKIAIMSLTIASLSLSGCQGNTVGEQNTTTSYFKGENITKSTSSNIEDVTETTNENVETTTEDIMARLEQIPFTKDTFEYFLTGNLLSKEIIFDENIQKSKCRVVESYIEDHIFFTCERHLTHELEVYDNEWSYTQEGYMIDSSYTITEESLSGKYGLYFVEKIEGGTYELHRKRVLARIEPWEPEFSYNEGRSYGVIDMNIKGEEYGNLIIKMEGEPRGFDISGEQKFSFFVNDTYMESKLDYVIEEDGFRYTSDDVGEYTTVRMLFKKDTKEKFFMITYTDDGEKETTIYRMLQIDENKGEIIDESIK